MKTLMKYVLVLAIAFTAASCVEDAFGPLKDENTPPIVPPPPPPPPKP